MQALEETENSFGVLLLEALAVVGDGDYPFGRSTLSGHLDDGLFAPAVFDRVADQILE